MARKFSTYFSNLLTVEDVDDKPDPVIAHAVENTLTDIDCSEPEVEANLKELKADKATGSNGFLPKVPKAVVDGVVSHLCQIVNISLTTAEVSFHFRLRKSGPSQKWSVHGNV